MRLVNNYFPHCCHSVLGRFNEVFEKYYKALFHLYNTAFPVVMARLKGKKMVPWMTRELKQCIKKKEKLYKLYMKGSIAKNDYAYYKNRLTNLLRRAKRLYFFKMFFNANNDASRLWRCIYTVMEKKASVSLEKLNVDGVFLVGNDLINYVNRYFVEAAAILTNGLSLPPPYMFLSPPAQFTCYLHPTNMHEVLNIIKRLKNKCNVLLDISPALIKENAEVFSQQLSCLYNMSIIETIFPSLLKVGRITPVHKSGSVVVVDNYRPISVLPIISKVFERLTLDRMMSFITTHDIFSPSQFGFRKGRNTTQAVIKLLSHVTSAYHNREYSACFFLDLRKAFDTVNHRILLEKLWHYGFRGVSHEYLKSYFQNRKQYVYLNNMSSDLMPITAGVPQGSILGPLCFILFINDLPLYVDAFTVLFADDAAFVVKSTTLSGLYHKIVKLFHDLEKYLNMNNLIPNSNKSKLMMFNSRTVQDMPEFAFAGSIIEWVREYKYLGLTLTSNISFARHISNISLNISRISGTLSGLVNHVPVSILLKLYYALAYPHLMGHIVVWGASPVLHLRTLNVRINNLLRLILRVPWENGRPTVSNDDLYQLLGVLKVDSVFRLNLFKFLKQLLDGKFPEFYDVLLRPYHSLRNYNTRGGIFRQPHLSCEVERRALSHQLIALYNETPNEVLNAHFSASLRHYKALLLANQ